MDIGERIKYLREAQRMDKTELAEAAGLSRTAVYQFESGQRTPSGTSLEKLSRGLGVPVAQLFSDEPVEVHVVLAGKAQAPRPGPPPEDPSDYLLKLLEDTSVAYQPGGLDLSHWSAATFDDVASKLAAAAGRAVRRDYQQDRPDRAGAIMEAALVTVSHLAHRKEEKCGEALDLAVLPEAPSEPSGHVRHDLAESDAVLRQLQDLKVA